ncbi:putative cytoplasmic protein [Salmonella enterica subsp. enterica]|uniref:Putative cytoplasmic protein n=1 Tax=Salmonella enterica I TaxID=59201 RepID=A0A447U2D0_SALET|nr:putative cytoplasmic protein [Salmonella enterica subsp. enterica]
MSYFPARFLNDRLHTFSAYERMSTALTAAQVFGVQRLCRYYAAHLAPLPGPDASRESNQRLAQITQYARQLAGFPLRYQYAGPRTACRGGINRPGYRTHQSDHWVYRFSGAGSGDISGVLPSARARTARPGDAALCQGPRGFKTPRRYGGPPPVW